MTYTVTEAAKTNYRPTPANGIRTGVIPANDTAAAEFSNAYSAPVDPPITPTTGDLVISKTVTGAGAPATDEFVFTVTFSTGRAHGGVASGSTITLRAGETRTITGIPDGVTYTVTEAEKTNDTPTPANRTRTGVIRSNDTATAEFSNAYTAPTVPPVVTPTVPPIVTPTVPPTAPPAGTGSLTVSKTVTGDLGDTSMEFTFKITFNAAGSYSYTGSKTGAVRSGDTVLLKHGESVTVSGLPAGTAYSVTESGGDGYEVYATGDTGVIAANSTATAAFTNDRSEVPYTGDGSSLRGYFGLALLSALGVGALLLAGRGKSKKRREI